MYWYSRHLCSITQEDHLPKYVCLPFKASILNSLGSPSAKLGLSANFGVLVFKALLLYCLGDPSAKVCSSSIQGIYSQYPGGSLSQSRFVCQFWCTGIQGIAALLPGGVHLPKYVCLPFKASILDSLGGPLAKVGSSDECEHTSKLLLNNFWCNCLQEIHSHFGGSIGQSRLVCQVLCAGIQGIYALLIGGSIGQRRFI